VKIPSFRVTQHFADELNWALDLVVSVRLPPFNHDSCTNHIACSRYVELHGFVGFWGYQSRWGSQIFLQVFKGLLGLLSLLKLVLFLEELKERESPYMES
jgi:hypothetical protein